MFVYYNFIVNKNLSGFGSIYQHFTFLETATCFTYFLLLEITLFNSNVKWKWCHFIWATMLRSVHLRLVLDLDSLVRDTFLSTSVGNCVTKLYVYSHDKLASMVKSCIRNKCNNEVRKGEKQEAKLSTG